MRLIIEVQLEGNDRCSYCGFLPLDGDEVCQCWNESAAETIKEMVTNIKNDRINHNDVVNEDLRLIEEEDAKH